MVNSPAVRFSPPSPRHGRPCRACWRRSALGDHPLSCHRTPPPPPRPGRHRRGARRSGTYGGRARRKASERRCPMAQTRSRKPEDRKGQADKVGTSTPDAQAASLSDGQIWRMPSRRNWCGYPLVEISTNRSLAAWLDADTMVNGTTNRVKRLHTQGDASGKGSSSSTSGSWPDRRGPWVSRTSFYDCRECSRVSSRLQSSDGDLRFSAVFARFRMSIYRSFTEDCVWINKSAFKSSDRFHIDLFCYWVRRVVCDCKYVLAITEFMLILQGSA